MQNVDLKTFKSEVEDFDGIVVADFWAPWCGPCRMLGPILEDLSNDFSDNKGVKFVKINTDENRELAMQFQIRGIPAVKVFKNGKVIDEFVGAAPKEVFNNMLKKHI